MNTKNSVKTLAAAIFLATSTGAMAFDLANRPYEHVSGRAIDDRLSYELGGGAAYGAASSRIRRPAIGFGVQWKADMMCGNMDLQLSLKNQLNGATDGFKSIMGNIVNSAQGAVASLPALIIQRANPGLYELLSNGVLQGRVDFDRSKLSCQSILDKAGTFMDGGNLQDLAKAETLHNAIKNNSGDAIAAEKEADDVGTEKGVKWMGETRGGAGQEPIRLTRDVVRKAHNTAHGRTVATNAAVSSASCDGGAFCTLWPTPEDAENFAEEVIGETELTTCVNGCDPARIRPGTGLLHKVDEVYEEKAEVMARLMNPDVKISNDDIAELSTPLLPVSRRIIEALRHDPDGQMLSERLTSEVALADLIWKGIQLMRLMNTGLQNPDVQKLAEAKEHVTSKIADLKSEIESMKLELDLRASLANNTAKITLERQEADRAGHLFMPSVDPVPNRIEEAAKGQP